MTVLRVVFSLQWRLTRSYDGKKHSSQWMSTIQLLQNAQFSYADDLAVASSSFRDFMFVLSPAFRSFLLASTWIIANAVGFSIAPKSMMLWVPESLRNAKSFHEIDIVRRAKNVGTMIRPNGHLHRWSAHRSNHPARTENECVYDELGWAIVWFQDLRDFRAEFHFLVCAPDKATLKAENHACSSVYHSRTVLRYPFFITFGRLHLWTWSWFTWHPFYQVSGSLSGCSMFSHSPQRSRKGQWGTRAHLHYSLCCFYRLEQEFLFPDMTVHTANAFDIICRLDLNDTLDKVLQKKRKLPPVCFWTSCLHKALLGLSSCVSRVLGPTSRHRIASRAGLLVGFLRTLSCTAWRFHTAENDNTCRIGWPNEPDSLTHYNECPSLCNFSLFLGYCHGIFLYMTWSSGCSCGAFNMVLWFWASLTHLFMSIIITALILKTLEMLVIVWQEGFDSWLSSLLPTPMRTKQLLRCTCLAVPAALFPTSQAQVQVSISSQWSFPYNRASQWLSWVCYLYRRWYSRCGWWNLCWMECDVTIPSWTNLRHVWSGCHYIGPSGFLWCQNSLQQHSWNDCHVWSIVVSWSSRFCDSWWTVTYWWWLYAGHDPGLHTCAAGAACQHSMIRVQHRLRLTMQHVYGHSGIWVTNAPIMLLPLAHLGSFLAVTSPRAGFVIALTPLSVLMAVKTSATS